MRLSSMKIFTWFKVIAIAAEKFPILVTSLVEPLRDFLVKPSPILSKLNKYSRDSAGATDPGSFRITVTHEGQRSVGSPLTLFFFNLLCRHPYACICGYMYMYL